MQIGSVSRDQPWSHAEVIQMSMGEQSISDHRGFVWVARGVRWKKTIIDQQEGAG